MNPKNDKKLLELLKSSGKSQPLKIADLAVAAGLSIGATPAAGAIYAFTKFGANSIRKYLAERSESKLQEFHRKLLLNDSDMLDQTLQDGILEIADYHALLQSCLADIEDEKTAIYGRLAKAIALNTVPKELRRHLILTLKEITWDQLDLLARVYVLSKGNIQPSEGAGRRSPTEAIAAADPYSKQGIDSDFLKLKSLISSEKITTIGKIFAESCLPSENLEPAAFGYKQWIGVRQSVITLDSPSSNVFSACNMIARYFREMGIEGGTGPLEGSLDRSTPMMQTDFFLIAYANKKELIESRKENLIKTIRNRPSLQLIFTSNSTETPNPILESEFIALPINDMTSAAKKVYEKMGEILLARKKKNSHP